jgi:hypothetical protein
MTHLAAPLAMCCCPDVCRDPGDDCCSTNGCVSSGEACCQGGYTRPSGWDCCTEGFCYPVDGQYCSTGYYCTPGNICVRFDGVQKCCTNDQYSAYVSSGVAITGPSSPTGTGSVVTVPTTRTPTTTNSGSETTLAASFEYYYFTITWYVHFRPTESNIDSALVGQEPEFISVASWGGGIDDAYFCLFAFGGVNCVDMDNSHIDLGILEQALDKRPLGFIHCNNHGVSRLNSKLKERFC